jgi:hypothetical protein
VTVEIGAASVRHALRVPPWPTITTLRSPIDRLRGVDPARARSISETLEPERLGLDGVVQRSTV